MLNAVYPNELFLATKLFLYEETKPFVLRAKEFPEYDVFVNEVLLNPNQEQRLIEWRPVRAIVHVKSQFSLEENDLKKIHSLGDVQDYLQQQNAQGKSPKQELSHVDFEISVDREWKETTKKRLREYLKGIVAQPENHVLSFEKQLGFFNKYLQSSINLYFPTEFSINQKEVMEMVAKYHRSHGIAAKQFQFLELLITLWFSELISILQTDVKVNADGAYYTADIELANAPDDEEYFTYAQVRSAFQLPVLGSRQVDIPYLDKTDQLIVYKKDGSAIAIEFGSAEKALKLLKTFFELKKQDTTGSDEYTSEEVVKMYKRFSDKPIDHTQIGQDRANAWSKIKDKPVLNELIEWYWNKSLEKWIFKLKRLEE